MVDTLESLLKRADSLLARLDRLVFGTDDPKTGACGSLYNIVQDGRLNHRLAVTPHVLQDDCRSQLQAFFQRRRQENSSSNEN